MTVDEQEALSRAHSDDIIRLLPLRSGAVAIFNNARELCAILNDAEEGDNITFTEIRKNWRPSKPTVDLEELGLL